MKINVSIEARMTSTRLPGKVMMPINGKVNLEIMVDRVKKSKLIDNIIIATTTNKEDDIIVSWCEDNNIDYFRGSEDNVYDRVLKTHIKYKSDIIVELTGDCPLIDPTIIDKAITMYNNNDYDYISTGGNYPIGMGIQVYNIKVLKSISKNRKLEYQDMEHVTPYIYKSGKYHIGAITPKDTEFLNNLSVTLDTKEDLEVIENICKNFGNFDFSLEDIVKFAKENPRLVLANQEIQRKGLN